jgi:hypothetical protein
MEHDNPNRVDELLNAALDRYGAAEPRPGLESRILAKLEAAGSVPRPNRLWWPMAAVCAAMLLLAAIWFIGRGARIPASQPMANLNHRASPNHSVEAAGNSHGAVAAEHRSPMPARAKSANRSQAPIFAAVRQEQFPSPEPLSQQEELLARYVEQFHHEAVLVARAQTELFQQDASEREALPVDRITQDQDKFTQQPNP